jgi:hypothetical protein
MPAFHSSYSKCLSIYLQSSTFGNLTQSLHFTSDLFQPFHLFQRSHPCLPHLPSPPTSLVFISVTVLLFQCFKLSPLSFHKRYPLDRYPFQTAIIQTFSSLLKSSVPLFQPRVLHVLNHASSVLLPINLNQPRQRPLPFILPLLGMSTVY